MGTGDSSLGVMQPGREADHSPPSTAEIKNAWSYTSTLQYAFMAWCSVKAQGQVFLSRCRTCTHVCMIFYIFNW